MKDKVVSIQELSQEFKSEQDLKVYCDKQFEVINKLAAENIQLKEEIEHLKYVLASQTEIINLDGVAVKLVVSKEQALLEEQVFRIKNRFEGKDIDLETTKILDLLLKNLNIIKGVEPKPIKGTSRKLPSSVEDLTKLASKAIDEVKPDEQS